MHTSDALTPRSPLPWSKKRLRRLGEVIRDGGKMPENTPEYDDVMLWYNDLAAAVRADLQDHDWGAVVNGTFEVTVRAKTIGTLRDKLRRDRDTPLSNIQDVAGVRFEAEMTLSQQDQVAAAVVDMYGHTPDCLTDLRNRPRCGYRAVHVRLRLEAPVEVQVRSHLQGGWANMYERIADVLGRDIRYGGSPKVEGMEEFVDDAQRMSTDLGSQLELLRDHEATTVKDVQRLRTLLDAVYARPQLANSVAEEVAPLEERTSSAERELERVRVERRASEEI